MLGIRHIEKDVHRTDRHIPLFEGEDIPHPDPDSPFAETGTNVHLEQMKDMLLTYNEYNRDLGYVQGMSDLLAPIYAVEQDDAVAFWGFVGFMKRMVSFRKEHFARLANLPLARNGTSYAINPECVHNSSPSITWSSSWILSFTSTYKPPIPPTFSSSSACCLSGTSANSSGQTSFAFGNHFGPTI